MRYAKYRSTGIAWLPEVPEEWEMRPLKTWFKSTFSGSWGKDVSSGETGVVCYRMADFDYEHGILSDDKLTFRSYKSSELEGKLLLAGDLLIEKSGGGDASPVGRVVRVVSSRQATCSNFIQQVRCGGEVDSSFSCYIFSVLYARRMTKYFFNQTTGIQNLKVSRYLSLKVPFPPLSTQRAIVAYLDEKCGKVDRLVAAKEKETALLKELKQSMIAEAVTRGVRSKRRLVPSGIPWLPEVPEGWEMKRAKYLFQKEQRPVRAGDEIVTCFRDGEVTLRKNRRISGFTEATDYSHYQHICVGDLVIHQMDAFAGSCGVSNSDGMGTPVLSVCTPKNDRLDVRYFAAVVRLMGLNGFIQSLYRGIRERSSDFRFETFAKQVLPVPSLAEQREIVAYIEVRAAKIDAAVKGLEREVAALKEYKQRLIADVVTGQRKVA